jgi:lipopolysaccharide export system permease protein
MTVLDRYLFSRQAGMVLRALLSLVVLFIFIDLLTHLNDAIRKHEVPWQIVARYYLAMTPLIVTEYVAPFAMLVATLLVVGDAAQNNETTAALAGGISLRRFMRMPVLVALLAACGLLALQETVGVSAARTARDIENNYFSRNPDIQRRPATWVQLGGRWTCHILKYNRLAHTGEGVFIYALEPGRHHQIQAQRIWWDPDQSKWMLERGWWTEFDPNSDAQLLNERITRREAPFSEAPEALLSFEQPPHTKTAGELMQDIRHARERNMVVRDMLVDLHTRFARPPLAFIMALIAIPCAIRMRRGGLAIGFGAGIAIALVYLAVFSLSVGLGQMGKVDPIVAAWAANALFLATALVMIARTPT